MSAVRCALGIAALLSLGCQEIAGLPSDVVVVDDDGGGPLDLPCPPGELLDGATCRQAGILGDCGAGFSSAGEGAGCVAVLPPEPCVQGTMAVPGQTACVVPTACATLEPGRATGHVRASADPGGNGSVAAPWATLQEALDQSAPGSVIVIEDGGVYEESLVIDKPVHIHGVGSPLLTPGSGGISIEATAAGTKLSGLEIDGPLRVTDATDVALRCVSLKHGGKVALDIHGGSVEVEQSLVEPGGTEGIVADGARVVLDRSLIRGGGVGVLLRDAGGSDPSLVVRDSVIEAFYATGVLVEGSTARVERSVVRDGDPTTTTATAVEGLRLSAAGPAAPSRLDLLSSVIERVNRGVTVTSSHLYMETTTIRDVVPPPAGQGGYGLYVSIAGEAQPGDVAVRRSLIERTTVAGVLVLGADAELDSVVIRDVRSGSPASGPETGRGVSVEAGSATLRGCLIEDAWDAGAFVSGTATLEGTLIRRVVRPPDTETPNFGVFTSDALTKGLTTVTGCGIEQAFVGVGVIDGHAEVGLTAFDCTAAALLVDGGKLEVVGDNLCTACGGGAVDCSIAEGSVDVLTAVWP